MESCLDKKGRKHVSNDYTALFYSHLCHRQACYSCQFAAMTRYSDITIGGFLDLDMLNEEYIPPVSMVLINTRKGKEWFDAVKRNARVEKCGKRSFKNQPCLERPISLPFFRENFWNEYRKYGLEFCIRKYATTEIKKKYHLNILAEENEMTEQQIKYNRFYENDIKNNRGLIVNQYKEVETIMNYPIFTECFRKGYLEKILQYATEQTEFYKPYKNFKTIRDFPIINKQIIR